MRAPPFRLQLQRRKVRVRFVVQFWGLGEIDPIDLRAEKSEVTLRRMIKPKK